MRLFESKLNEVVKILVMDCRVAQDHQLLAQLLTELGMYDNALQQIALVQNIISRAELLSELSRQCSGETNMRMALEFTEYAENLLEAQPIYESELFAMRSEKAWLLSECGQKESADCVWNHLKGQLDRETDRARQDWHRSILAPYLARAGYLEEAKTMCLLIQTLYLQFRALRDVIPEFAKRNDLDSCDGLLRQAHELSRIYSLRQEFDVELSKCVDKIVDANQCDLGRAMANWIHEPTLRIGSLIQVARKYRQLEDTDSYQAALSEAERALESEDIFLNGRIQSRLLLHEYFAAGSFKKGFSFSTWLDADNVVSAIISGLPAFEKFESGLGKRILTDVVRIAAWVKPAYAQVVPN